MGPSMPFTEELDTQLARAYAQYGYVGAIMYTTMGHQWRMYETDGRPKPGQFVQQVEWTVCLHQGRYYRPTLDKFQNRFPSAQSIRDPPYPSAQDQNKL